MNNPYGVFEVPIGTSKETIKPIYRELCKKYHPDNPRTGNREKFEELMIAWNGIDSFSTVRAWGKPKVYCCFETIFRVRKVEELV